jgi:Rieske Fe-S protein
MRTGTTSFEAISMICPHQGAVVELAGSPTFRCPSHLAEFAADGTWIGGRQTGDLTALGVTFDSRAGTVTINGRVAAGPPPSMLVTPNTEVFTATQNGANPAPQLVSITNTGGGTLSGLDVVVGYGAGQPSGWLSATLDVQAAPAILTLQPATKPLTPGTYTATVQITAPTAINAPQAVTVSFTIAAPAAPPTIVVGNTTVAFAAAVGGASPVAQQIPITNGGGGSLSGLSLGAITYGAGASGWLAGSLSTTTAPASLILIATLGALRAGTYTASLPIAAAGANNTPQQILVTFTVAAATAPPTISLSSSAVTFNVTQGAGSAPPQTLTVQNGGGGVLAGLTTGPIAYGAGASGWLSVALSTSTAPATLTLTATPSTLAAGTYTATVPVSAAGVSNSPQLVSVTLVVGVAAAIAVSPANVSFAASIGTTPGGQIVNISSSGAPLSGIAFTVAYGSGATGWLAASTLSATSTPAALTLRVTTSGLPAGTYTANVQISATGATPKTIPVSLVVNPAGLAVVIANWPALANIGGIVGSVGTVQGTPTAVVRTGATTFAAFSMRCPHQGTTIRIENWNNTGSAFHCPNHDALFDSAGRLLPRSPQTTTNLVTRTVTYTAGSTTLYIT